MNADIKLTPVVTPKESSLSDRYMIDKLRIPGVLLMEQASDEVARAAASLCGKDDVILVLCGKGNNGGDGLAAARILISRGYNVKVGVTSENYSDDAGINFEFFKAFGGYTLITPDNTEDIFACDAKVIIDALFGTGLSREPGGIYAELISLINAHPAKVVSVDIPSGVFGETGQCGLCVDADITVTFQYPKIGHYIYPGAEHAGRLIIKKIGVDDNTQPCVYHVDDVTLPPRARNTNKGSYGKLTIMAGSKNYSGAAILCTHAAMRTGSGLTTCLCDSVTAIATKAALPEAMAKICGDEYVCDEQSVIKYFNATAAVIGPGLGTEAATAHVVKRAVSYPLPKVIDADALNILSNDINLLKGTNCVITPHPREFSRLTNIPVSNVLSNPIKHACDLALKLGIVVLLKGASTVITDGRTTFIVTAGAPSMAKGGSGDVLSGVIGGLLAQGYGLLESAYMGAFLCGKAGEAANKNLGDYAPLAGDTIDNLNIWE